jgi:hypothetical protein
MKAAGPVTSSDSQFEDRNETFFGTVDSDGERVE